jgi:hypothetical protein
MPRIHVHRPRAIHGALGALVLPLALACGPAAANDLPARKPGLWEMSITSGKEPAVSTRQCIDAATDARMQQAGRGLMSANCSKDVTRREGARWISESVCKLGSSTVTSRSVTTGDFQQGFRVEVESRYAPPLMGTAQDASVIEARWAGPCPAGWKPGDMELPGTQRRMNINEMPGAAPPRK